MRNGNDEDSLVSWDSTRVNDVSDADTAGWMLFKWNHLSTGARVVFAFCMCVCVCKNEQLQRDIFLQFGNVLSVMHLKLKRQRNVSLNKPFTQFLHLSRQLQACYLSIIRETHEKMLSIQFFFFFYVSFLPFPCIHTFLHFLMTMHFQTFFSQFTYDCIAQSHTTLRYARFYFIQFVKTKK